MTNRDVVKEILTDAVQEAKKKRVIEIAYRSRKIQNRKKAGKVSPSIRINPKQPSN